MVYITVTDHCIKQIINRNPINDSRYKAVGFGLELFKRFLNGNNGGREIRIKYTKNGKYRITDGFHQFIFAKPYKIEYVLITYVKRDIPLGPNLRKGEKKVEDKYLQNKKK